MLKQQIITLESDVKNSPEIDNELIEYCKLYSSLERQLFNHCIHHPEAKFADLQRQYVQNHHIHARTFKTLFKQVKGRIQAIQSNNKTHLAQIQNKIKQLQEKIKYLSKTMKSSFLIHNIHRKINRLKQKLHNPQKLQSVWGSKSFHKKQWQQDNKKQWLKEWRIKRDHNICFIGSSDESFGNQMCQLQTLQTLRLTLPKFFSAKHLHLTVDFQKKKKIYSYLMQAINNSQSLTWRIFQNYKNKKWYAQVSFTISNECTDTRKQTGAVGLDINYNLIALCNVKPDGNKTEFKNLKYELDKNNSNKNNQILSNIANEIIQYAKQNNKTIIIEKISLKTKTKNSKISWVVYHKFFTLLKSRAVKESVLIVEVNPAYTSVIGGIKYQKRFGVSRHASASHTIARRGLNFIEKIPVQIVSLLHSGERKKHSWARWNLLNKRLNKASEYQKSSLLNYYRMSRRSCALQS